MQEYDLVCDVCRKPLEPADAVVSWTLEGTSERGFTLGHTACVPATATSRLEVRRLVLPNEFLGFVSERAPFVVRHDNPAEMDILRAASFGARPGVKPGVDEQTPHARDITERPGKMPAETHTGK